MSQRITILGGGESGTGAAVLAKKLGNQVFLSDAGGIKTKYKDVLSHHGIEWEEGGHSPNRILDSDLVIKSPGIPEKAPIIKELNVRNIPWIDEIEYAYQHTNGKIIAITGSNGKTTTTLLTHHMLVNAGLDVGLGGNIGKSFALQVAERDRDYWVLEVSSFQLDGTRTFRPYIAILMNITPDHLDRYNYDFQNYIDSKMRITRNQTPSDHLIFWQEDPVIVKELSEKPTRATCYPFALVAEKTADWKGARVNNEELEIQTINNQLTMSIHDLALKGKHNLFNSMASGVAGRILELRKEVVRDSLTHFENIEHRLEFVAKVAGITFINDSKATNVNSTWYALESMDKPVIWIAGGVDKGNDYNELMPLVQERVKALICLGKDNSKLHEAFGGVVDQIVDAESAQEAVNLAYELGYKGDAVLLSPACASFDLFESYEDRGHQFKQAVRSL
ncbi:MAG: UDP-N-acetylmuramoyl-L-alanine--D-glutamate ligase [Flavobacteriales bacterium]|nr:UDP-N-acetylmuramoyl-L-alanine--D-glutamate ligase [Flavobacteriales bacterium]